MRFSDIINYITENYIELLGTVLSLIYLYLSIKEKISLWIFGFLCSALYVIVFFQSKFYADMSLQFYYLVVSVFGWINWKRKGNSAQQSNNLFITSLSKTQILQYAIATILIYIVYFLILKFLTDSTIPVMDSVVGALSVVATWMLAKKKIENWLLWIVADAIAAGLYIYKGLYPTFVLYVVYTIMAIVGYFEWKKSLKSKV